MVKVGIFATLCLVVLALLIWKIEDLNPFTTKGQRLDAVFTSVAGLDDKASVRVAGVQVGQVDGVGLEGNKAASPWRSTSPSRLTLGTRARIANLGLLGEKYVELIPGPPNAPPLPPGTVLVGETPPSLDDAMAKINDIGASIQQVTGQLSGGNVGRRPQQPDRGHPAHQRRVRGPWWPRTGPTWAPPSATSTRWARPSPASYRAWPRR